MHGSVLDILRFVILDCTRRSYILLYGGEFVLPKSTVSKFGKVLIIPLYYLIHFSRSLYDNLEFSWEKGRKLKEKTFRSTNASLNATISTQLVWPIGKQILRGHDVHQLIILFNSYKMTYEKCKELANRVRTEHLVALNWALWSFEKIASNCAEYYL